MWQVLALLIFGGTTAAAARGIYTLADSPLALALLEDAQPQQLPPPQPAAPQPDYQIPRQWGGDVDPDLVAIASDRPTYPDPPDPGAVLPGELYPYQPAPTAARPQNPVTADGSALSGNNGTAAEPARTAAEPATEPRGIEPPSQGEVLDLLESCPFPVAGTFGPDEWRLFCALKGAGRTQTQAIKTLWGVSKNGSAKYVQARDRYIALAETWHQIKSFEAKS